MSKILSAIPVLSGAAWTQTCLDAIKSDILIIDNNADADVKKVIKNRNIIVNEKNEYVNFAWNQALEYFLSSKYEYIAIINSDLLLMKNWEDFVEKYYEDKTFMVPRQVRIEDFLPTPDNNSYKVFNDYCFQGVFILLNKEMADLIYPIPVRLKLWFGDAYIWYKLKKYHYEKRIYDNFICVHGNSVSLSILGDEAIEIIENDKKEWEIIKKNYAIL